MIFNHIPTKDAKTLGGHAPSYFAPLESIGYLTKYARFDESWTKIEDASLGLYPLSKENAYLTDMPEGASTSVSNLHWVLIMKFGDQTSYYFTEPQSNRFWIGRTYGTGITWKEVASIANLANYLPLTGGTLSGALTVNGNIIAHNTAENFSYMVFRSKGTNIGYLGINAGGEPAFMDTAYAARTILHTGNMADHVLPKSGGSIKGAYTPLTIENTENTGGAAIAYATTRDGYQGFLGMHGVNNPVFTQKDGVTFYTLHHDGNSAKVHIGTSAPSDTTALWIDTSA